MALSDWQPYSLGAGVLILEVINPVLGTGTGLPRASSSGDRIAADLSAKSGATLGVTYGLTRGKLRSYVIPHDVGSLNHQGLYCLANNSDIVNIPSNFYTLNMPSNSNDFHLVKYTNNVLIHYSGIPGGPAFDVLMTGGAWSHNVGIAIELEWFAYDSGVTYLYVRTGTQADYSDLSLLFTYTDTTSPHTVSVGEGVFGLYQGGVSRTLHENTTLIGIL